MKTKRYRSFVANFMKKITTAIIAGIPDAGLKFKPWNRTTVYLKNKAVKPDIEKHYHRSKSKPAVEKQTLLKETKKAKTSR